VRRRQGSGHPSRGGRGGPVLQPLCDLPARGAGLDRRVHRPSDHRPEPGRAGRPDRTTAFPTKCTAGPVPDRPPSPNSHPDTASARRAPAATAADPCSTIRCSREAHRPSRAEPVAHSTGPARADCVVAAYYDPDVDGVGEPQHHPGCDPVAAAITDHPPDDPTTHVDTPRDPNRNTDVDPNVHPDGNGNFDDLPGGYRHPDADPHADADVQSHVVIDAISNAFPVPHTQPVTAAPT